ncbi:copper chaperone PCu(A)C [Actinocorallia sp. API 0066]|uniref:copper chaperone PCu(A)C n=1 Tax=Actinocorallia sp. API 0066 TaxID=2896846 RepID=UPI001E470136|nr:copper chaperone PCu(A)C [Actinocorallia sp. API 0066]MCD0449630.1 copper chaperone PCu(A)C [Actinocorallia sp. API 0066]
MRIASIAAATALGGLLLAGCDTQGPEPGSVSPEAGVDGQVGKVDLRDVFVLGGDNGADVPAGGSAPVYLTLVNYPAGGETDGTSGTQGEADTLQSVTSPAAQSAEIIGGPIPLPPGEDVRIGPAARIVLKGLTAPLAEGTNVQLTFTFEKAGQGTMSVPVQSRQESLSTYSPAP